MKLSMLYSSEYCSSPHSSGRFSRTDLTLPLPEPELGGFTAPAWCGDSEKRSRTWGTTIIQSVVFRGRPG